MFKIGSLIEYLKRETALNALEKTVKHVQKVQECVKELEKGLIMLLKEKNLEKTHDIFHNVDLLEGEADGLRRGLQRDISKGELDPSVRQNLSHLIKRIDDVANCCNGVARRIATVPVKFWEQSSEETINLIIDIMKTTVNCAQFLDKIVNDFVEERKNVKEIAGQINQREITRNAVNQDTNTELLQVASEVRDGLKSTEDLSKKLEGIEYLVFLPTDLLNKLIGVSFFGLLDAIFTSINNVAEGLGNVIRKTWPNLTAKIDTFK